MQMSSEPSYTKTGIAVLKSIKDIKERLFPLLIIGKDEKII